MPFTPTHVIAILPAAKCGKWLPFSALAIGSMMPDFPLFFPLGPDYRAMHSPTGLFTGCLPIGIGLFILFQLVVKVPIVSLLPRFVQARLSSCRKPRLSFSAVFWIQVSAAVLLGALSHVVWDSFTHEGRWGTKVLPILNEPFAVFDRMVPGFKLFQFGSTLVGLPFLTVLSAIWLLKNSPEPVEDDLYPFSFRAKAIGILTFFAIPCAATLQSFKTGNDHFYVDLFYAVTNSGFALSVSAIVFAFLFHIKTNGSYSAFKFSETVSTEPS